MKYITVKLTEDQARYVLKLVHKDTDNNLELPNDELAFCKRVLTQFHKALNPYITES